MGKIVISGEVNCEKGDEDVNLVVTESNENADEVERIRTNSQDIGDAGVIATTNAKEYLDLTMKVLHRLIQMKSIKLILWKVTSISPVDTSSFPRCPMERNKEILKTFRFVCRDIYLLHQDCMTTYWTM